MIHVSPEATLDRCIKCNICVTACPVAAVTDVFPGPKYEGPQAGRFRGADQPLVDHSVDYCSGCRVCNQVCPTGVKIAEINARARAVMVSSGAVSRRLRLRNNLVARPELVGRLVRPLAPLANVVLRNQLGRAVGERVLGLDQGAPIPFYRWRGFRSWFKRHPRPAVATRTVAYFQGCSTEYFEPRVGRAAVAVLEANGFRVLLPPQNCCGLPLLSNGEFKAAARYHNSNIAKLVGYVKDGIDIVGTSTSCTLTLKQEAPELLGEYGEAALMVAEHTFDLHEFLRRLRDEGQLAPVVRGIPFRLAYHQPCQYRAHQVGSPAAELMEMIPGLEIVESQAACCGIAGTYGYKQEKYAIAMAVGAPLFDLVLSVGGPLVACDSETCRWQITHGTGVPAIHPVELLAYAYGNEPEGPLAEALRSRG